MNYWRINAPKCRSRSTKPIDAKDRIEFLCEQFKKASTLHVNLLSVISYPHTPPLRTRHRLWTYAKFPLFAAMYPPVVVRAAGSKPPIEYTCAAATLPETVNT